ncbi:MAG: hypothetical protein AAGM16_06805 [Pseudomonadota bacterium]
MLAPNIPPEFNTDAVLVLLWLGSAMIGSIALLIYSSETSQVSDGAIAAGLAFLNAATLPVLFWSPVALLAVGIPLLAGVLAIRDLCGSKAAVAYMMLPLFAATYGALSPSQF